MKITQLKFNINIINTGRKIFVVFPDGVEAFDNPAQHSSYHSSSFTTHTSPSSLQRQPFLSKNNKEVI